MNQTAALKALADDTRLAIVKLLLQHRYCVRALSIQLKISDAAVSQHLKVLREADLLYGEKKGRYMHYQVNRDSLRALAADINALADLGLPQPGETSAHPTSPNCHQKQRAFCGQNTPSPCPHTHDKHSNIATNDAATSEGGRA